MDTNRLRTSDTHPLRIDAVQPNNGWGLIGMSFCPGKKQSDARTGRWDRDLAKDLGRIRDWGARMVISLVEEQEFRELQVERLPHEIDRLGMTWRHLPIRDRYPPAERFHHAWPTLGQEIVNRLRTGDRVFVHCKGGLGRTGTVAACLLIESGEEPDKAIAKVREARRHTIETAVQEFYVLNYKPQFSNGGISNEGL